MRTQLIRSLPAVSLLTAIFATASHLGAQSLWINPAGGDIATSSNWSGSIPSATQDGAFFLNSAYTVNVLNDFTAHNLVVTSGTVTFDLAAGKTLLMANAGSFGPQGGTAALTGSGTLLATFGFGAGSGGSLSVSNASVLAGYVAIDTGRITQSSGLVQTGEFMVGTGSAAAGVYNMSGGQVLVTGTALDGSGGSLRVGDFGGSGTFNQTGGLVQLISTSTDGNSLNIGNQGGHGVYNISSGTLSFVGSGLVTMGRSSGTYGAATGIFNISGDALVDINGSGTTANFIIGDNITSTNNGSGTINQTSGTLSIRNGANLYLSGFAPTISGTNTYNLNGGVLAIGGSSLKGAYNGSSPYAFNLGGGTIRVTGTDLTTSVNATLVSGTSSTIDTNGLNATWNGSFSGSNSQLVKVGSGTLTLTNSSRIDSFFTNGGVLAQTSGTVTSYEVGVGSGLTGTTPNVGVYNMKGGTLLISAGTPPPFVGGSASSIRVGDFGGSGTFNQTGGNVIINGSLNVGNQGGHGFYNISSGTLNFASGLSTLGRTSGGSTSSGGSTGELNISGSAVVNLSASTQLTLSNWYPYTGSGVQGNGVLNQTGGLLNVDNAATLTLTGFGYGVYNLTSGTLQIGGSSLVGVFGGENGTYDFNLGGGTIKVSGSDLTTSVNANLVSGASSTIDTNGLKANWSGTFTGTNGQLVKKGNGTLTITANNTIASFFTNGGTTSQTSGTTTSYELGVGSGLTGTNANVGTYSMTGGTLLIAAGTPPPFVGGQASSLRVGDFGGSGTFNQTGGNVIVNGSLNVGNQGGRGVYNISSGTLDLAGGMSTLGRTSGSSVSSGGSTGVLNLSGSGVVNVSGTATLVGSNWYPSSGIVQGSGTINQTGGLLNVANTASLVLTGQGNATYNLTSGTLQIGGSSLVGVFGGQSGTYNFNLGGGTIKVAGSDLATDVNANLVAGTADIGPASKIDTNGLNATWSGSINGAQGGLIKAGSGTLTFNGSGTRTIGYFNTDQGTTRQTAGTTTSTELVVGSNYSAKNGAFTLDGGTVNVSGSTPASSTSSFRVGDFSGTGVFNQNAGVVNADGAVILGNRGGTGSYNLSSGTFNVGQNAIPGTTGVIIGRSRAADATGSQGTLNITGGLLHLFSGAALQIGGEDLSDARSTGVVNQSGDSQVIVEKFIQLGDTGTGTYNLNGGTLQVNGANGIRKGAGTAIFNLAGGTLAQGSTFSTSVNLTVSGTASTIDTGAFTGTYAGSLLGSGLVTKVGSGTMLANGASSTASIQVNAGVLSGTGKTTGSVTVASGATLAGAVNVGGTTTVEQGATFGPGFSPAAVYNDGDLVMAGTMYIELSGSAGGTGTFTAPVTGQYDQVLYGGAGGITLTDDAVLQIASLSSYLPVVGDTFDILLATNLITADPSAVTVEGVGALSDYIFYLTLGTTTWNGGGSYNAVELHVLAVPEPGTYALLIAAGVFGLLLRRRKAGAR